jgi:hypothetical protein
VARRVELNIGDYVERKGRPTTLPTEPPEPPVRKGAPARLEPTTTLQARVPYTLADRLRDLARSRSRGGSRVSINALLIEAVERYLEQEGA